MHNTDPRPHPAPDGADLGPWQRVADELRACRETQRRAWGDIDNAELGRYLAGEAAPGDAARIENALEEHPELRKLTDLVRDVLGDPEPAGEAPPAPAPGPVLLRFQPRAPGRKGVAGWLRRRASLVAAACLVLIIGAAMPHVSPLAGPRDEMALSSDGHASLARGREMANDVRATGPGHKVATAALRPASVTLTSLSQGPKEADFPGLPAGAFDATKRGLNLHRRDGDLTKAEHELWRAVSSCRSAPRPNALATSNTVRLLADVYQVALNTEAPERDDRPVALHVARDPKVKSSRSEHARRTSALLLREQIAAKPAHEVRAKVVPVLTEALRVAPEGQERRRLLRALACLGPAAEPAVPVLTDRLTRTTDAQEAREVLAVIEQMGPGGKSALPVLARLGGVAAPRSAAKAANAFFFHFKAQPDDRKRAADIHARLQGREGRVGVRDQAGVFSVRAARDATRSFVDLARRGNVEVLVETSPGAPVKRCDPRDRALGRALIVRVYLKGPVVRVEAGDDLKDGQRLAERIHDRVLDCCQGRKTDYDKALRELVASLPPPAKKGAQPR